MIGKKFFKLTVISKTNKRTTGGSIIYKCKCDCGKIVNVIGVNLRLGRKQSCGCSQYPKGKESKHWKHGLSHTVKYRTEQTRKSTLKRFDMSFKEYISILKSQNESCAVCGKSQIANGKSFAIDHDHKTGIVRGLLCSDCNFMLGLAKDDIKLLLKAINYLKRG